MKEWQKKLRAKVYSLKISQKLRDELLSILDEEDCTQATIRILEVLQTLKEV